MRPDDVEASLALSNTGGPAKEVGENSSPCRTELSIVFWRTR